MTKSGNLRKMRTAFQPNSEVQYYMQTEDAGEWNVNDWIGKEIAYTFEGRINCVACGRLTKKSFGQGFCYPCFQNSPLNAECIIRPELCEAHLGKGRDPEWEETHHNTPHLVYLAASSGAKVGVTRKDQIPTRWIDQGASRGLIIAETDYRQQAGKIEVLLKAFVSDKTNWQRMLKNQVTDQDLEELKEELSQSLPDEWRDFIVAKPEWTINYPVTKYPEKVKSIKLDKVPEFQGILSGIKGQYLIFDQGMVLNIRNHSGYYVNWELS